MTDIVDRLKAQADRRRSGNRFDSVEYEAADEIERLREDSNTWARRCKEHMSSAKHMTARRDELERDLRNADDEIKRLRNLVGYLEQQIKDNWSGAIRSKLLRAIAVSQ